MNPRSLYGVTFAALVGMVLCNVAKAAPQTVGFTAISVRNASGANTERQSFESDGSPSRAIDGNFSTATYLTTSGTLTSGGPQKVFLDLGSPTYITGFRWDKTDGYVDPHNLSFLASTSSGALLSRSFSAVSNLQNGYGGSELVNGSFSGNSITGESDAGGFYSVTFDPIPAATAIRFDFSSGSVNDHYHVSEFQAIVPLPSAALGGMALLGGLGIYAAAKAKRQCSTNA